MQGLGQLMAEEERCLWHYSGRHAGLTTALIFHWKMLTLGNSLIVRLSCINVDKLSALVLVQLQTLHPILLSHAHTHNPEGTAIYKTSHFGEGRKGADWGPNCHQIISLPGALSLASTDPLELLFCLLCNKARVHKAIWVHRMLISILKYCIK